jgi:transcriptional regulator with XRE-family HTH domain
MRTHLNRSLRQAQQLSVKFFSQGFPTLPGMKTIEQVRLANLKRLVDRVRREDGANVPDTHVAGRLGITGAYLSLINAGKRQNINSEAARKIERKLNLPDGWMDTDFELWPFPDTELLASVERLDRDQRAEIQGAIRDKLAQFAGAAQVATPAATQPPRKGIRPSRGLSFTVPMSEASKTDKKSRNR